MNKKITVLSHESVGEKNKFLKENEQAIKKYEKELKQKIDNIEELKNINKKLKIDKENFEKQYE